MARSAPWLHWMGRDPGSGSRELKRWAEEEKEEEEKDFAEHIDAGGVIGLEEGLVAVSGRPRESRFVEALGRQVLDAPARVRRFSCREQQEFGQEEPGAEWENAGSAAPGDVEDPGDRTPAELAYWQPQQDVTEEEEEEQGSSGDEERLEGTSGAESNGELYPELSYEGQCGSERSSSPEAPHYSPTLCSPYEKSQSFSTDGGETSDVSLYADPPKPSHSVHMGTLGTGSKVMAFSIPQARTAAISTAPAPALQPLLDGEPAQGPVNPGTSPRPCSPPVPGMGCSACSGECGCRGQHPCPGTQLTQTLAGQTHKFQAQVESFEAWVQAGKSTPQEQLQRFRKLKDTQDALERTYLQAREENRRLQQHPGAAGEFDPDRTVEGEIFCLGMRLEELKDRLERAACSQRSPPWGC
ncbi:PREDICTED: AT-hook-containing transcription factor [Tinamus guttatus]|uniref:AT-hook-containing transcription factor n=1 Tax=Tinamus guttatus TaxID=94827 RepID=UPI00052E98D3|nr:PREDICTED: AT-hook-containing transcription factor [Tinamus guttatus]